MTRLMTIVEEPRGETYSRLLQFALKKNSLFSLVWREEFDFDTSAMSLEETLRSDLLSKRRTGEWPGTRLFGSLAVLRLYRMSGVTLATLGEAGGLYEWEAPARPEDLAFYMDENTPWLGSIAHERDAFVYSGAVDLQELSVDVPALRLEFVSDS
ncbi:MAG: hypothetical protein ACREMK_00405 [Gemmatimonadota bacterium]